MSRSVVGKTLFAPRGGKGKAQSMPIHLLSTRAVVRFTGPDATKLLNDTLTGRLEPAPEGESRWFALLSAQGKVQAEGLISFLGGAWYADIEAGTVESFVKRMSLYRLRAKVEIASLAETHAVLWSPTPIGQGIASADIRAGGLGHRAIVEKAELGPIDRDDTPYHAARIEKGIPELGPDFGVNEVFAHDIGMDLLDGIDFVKGCYVGQEVVSRMKHRGTARRRPVIVSGTDAPPGTPVLAGTREAGSIGRGAGSKAVAILRLDRITDPDAVTVDGTGVTLRLPDWASYRFGESGAED
jgi:folate-binding protein YgfZ